MRRLSEDYYAKVFRDLHPRMFPYSPRERRMELRCLWPVDQERFRETISAIMEHSEDDRK